MYTIKYDQVKNRVYITLKGILSEEKVKDYHEKCETLLKECRNGRTILTDLSEATVQRQQSLDLLTKLRADTSKKVKKSAVVVDSIFAQMQRQRTLRKKDNLYEEQYFKTVKEAENYLDN